MFFKKKYYYYQVKYVYKDKLGRELFHWYGNIGFKKRNKILNNRIIKQIQTPLHFNKKIKYLLCNGSFQVEVQCYLGKFSQIIKD